MAKILRLDLRGMFDAGIAQHAQVWMKEQGIGYFYAVPQSMADQWWFYHPQNLPSTLPSFVSVEEVDPFRHVGWGLSEQGAKKISEFKVED